MKEDIYKIIERIYFDRDYNYFIERCKNEMILPKAFDDYMNECGYEIREAMHKNEPERIFFIKYPELIKNDLKVSFRTILKISKIYPLYNIQHEFETEIKDSEIIDSTLDGFSDNPYTHKQYNLEETLCIILNEAGFTRLLWSEMEEVVEGLRMPDDVTLFGPQITVGTALFKDLFDIMPDDEEGASDV